MNISWVGLCKVDATSIREHDASIAMPALEILRRKAYCAREGGLAFLFFEKPTRPHKRAHLLLSRLAPEDTLNPKP